jgi:hypothetical protein
MMDEMEEKRGMVKMLLDMLKSSAAKEVSDGLKPPEGMPKDAKGLEIEKVSVVPAHEMDEPMPEHDILTKELPEHEEEEGEEHEMHKGGMAYHEGGEVTKLTAPKEMPLPTEDEDMEEMSSSPFASFLGKKKKK